MSRSGPSKGKRLRQLIGYAALAFCAAAAPVAADVQAESGQIPRLNVPPASPPTEPPPLPGHPTMISSPDWIKMPNGEQFGRYYPDRAAKMSVGGRAVIRCRVDGDGSLEQCVVIYESPPDQGFGEAALKLSALFRMRPVTRDGQSVAGGVVIVPIRFAVPGAPPEPSPSPSPIRAPASYPP